MNGPQETFSKLVTLSKKVESFFKFLWPSQIRSEYFATPGSVKDSDPEKPEDLFETITGRFCEFSNRMVGTSDIPDDPEDIWPR